ncbi:MAG: twin-arginine translocase subunit TatC [Candidatus Bathyarchaeia archaeon]
MTTTEEPGIVASFLEHIKELAQRAKVVIIVLLVSTVFFMLFPANPLDLLNPNSFLTGFYRPMISVMLNYVKNYVAPPNLQIISLQIGDPLEVYVFASLLLGFIVSSPVIGYEVFKFVVPALHEDEKKAIFPFVFGFTVFFIFGAIFGYLFLAPFMSLTVIIFAQFVGAQPIITAYDFYSMIFTTVLFTGIGFTFPVFFVLLVKFGIVGTSIITKNRTIFYIILYAITALISPDGGPLADLALFIPVAIMIEGAVLVAKRYEKNRPTTSLIYAQTGVEATCSYCGTKFKGNEAFCKKCGRSRI